MDCPKKKYLTQAAADAMLRWILARKGRMRKAARSRLSSYKCRKCTFWHLGKEREWTPKT